MHSAWPEKILNKQFDAFLPKFQEVTITLHGSLRKTKLSCFVHFEKSSKIAQNWGENEENPSIISLSLGLSENTEPSLSRPYRLESQNT